MATLSEIEQFWSIDDLFDAHEILDVKEAIKAEKEKIANRKG